MRISLIAAVGPGGEIGYHGRLPWPHLPEDLRRFARLTRRKPCIMGRRTWESLPTKPLLGRLNIVITGDPGTLLDQTRVLDPSLRRCVEPVADHHEALLMAGMWAGSTRPDAAAPDHVDEVCVIGGARTYAAFLDVADRIYLTTVDPARRGGGFAADTFFPAQIPLDPAQWIAVQPPAMVACVEAGLTLRFDTYERNHVRPTATGQYKHKRR